MSKLKLSKSIYDSKHILVAINDYSSLAIITLCEDNEYITVFFDECRYDLDITKMEFENYLIDISNSRSYN